MRLFLWFSNTVQSGYVAPGFLVVFCAPLCRGLLFSFDDSCDNIISLGCRQMVQDLIHFDTWHFALVTTCVCTTVTPCFPPSSSWTVLNQGNTRGEEDPRQLYGQFAFNSVPKEPPITRLLAYLSLHKTSLKPQKFAKTDNYKAIRVKKDRVSKLIKVS